MVAYVDFSLNVMLTPGFEGEGKGAVELGLPEGDIAEKIKNSCLFLMNKKGFSSRTPMYTVDLDNDFNWCCYITVAFATGHASQKDFF
jgi:hypothetical protein